jgi:hypothetical protein
MQFCPLHSEFCSSRNVYQRYIGDRYDVELCVQVNQLFPGHIVKLSHHVRKYILLRPLFYINITRYTMDATKNYGINAIYLLIWARLFKILDKVIHWIRLFTGQLLIQWTALAIGYNWLFKSRQWLASYPLDTILSSGQLP